MLVLSRQRDETIMIGDDVEITVVDIRGDKVRLGITAPTRIAVHRKEVYEAIRAENERAARIEGGDLRGLKPAASGRVQAGKPLTAAVAVEQTERATPGNGGSADGPPALRTA